MKLNKIYHSDCMELLSKLDDNSVDFFCLDPPYFMGNKPFVRLYEDYERVVEDWDNAWQSQQDYLGWCRDWIYLAKQKLKQGGVIIVFQSFHNVCEVKVVLDEFLTFRNFIPWYKPNAMNILAAKQKGVYAYSCEYILYHSKGTVAYFDYAYLKQLNGGHQHRDLIVMGYRPHKQSVGHPTQKPLALIEQLVVAHSPEGGLVVDCFSGSGTTAEVCLTNNRNFICGDAKQEYVDMAIKRLERLRGNLFYDVGELREDKNDEIGTKESSRKLGRTYLPK